MTIVGVVIKCEFAHTLCKFALNHTQMQIAPQGGVAKV